MGKGTRAEAFVALSPRFDRALQFAVEAHRKQFRKGSGVPYVAHLLGVSSLVLEEGGGEDLAIAALLHDVVEDQGGEPMLRRVRREFGDAVADVVLACSDTVEAPKPPWRERKEAYLARLQHEPPSVLLVSLADKLYNVRAIRRDYLEVGEKLWARFAADGRAQLWYYGSLSETFSRLLPTSPMTRELHDVVAEVNRLSAGAAGAGER